MGLKMLSQREVLPGSHGLENEVLVLTGVRVCVCVRGCHFRVPQSAETRNPHRDPHGGDGETGEEMGRQGGWERQG